MAGWDDTLWWAMLATGIAAAAISIAASWLDRRAGPWPTRRGRYLMHMTSYALLSLSIFAFVLRGLSPDP
jgi:hypothetical protein